MQVGFKKLIILNRFYIKKSAHILYESIYTNYVSPTKKKRLQTHRPVIKRNRNE